MDDTGNQIKTKWKFKMWSPGWIPSVLLVKTKTNGGGLAVGIVKDLESTNAREGIDDNEALVVETVVAYGAQENASKEEKENLWNFLEEEINKAEYENNGLIIQMDGNLHAGPG